MPKILMCRTWSKPTDKLDPYMNEVETDNDNSIRVSGDMSPDDDS
jgi:hypothetical protein